jgi:hypothetical protein
MFRFTIRDVLWLTVVVALAVALVVKQRDIAQLEDKAMHLERDSKTWESRANSLRSDLMLGTNRNTDVEFIPNGIRYKPKAQPTNTQ